MKSDKLIYWQDVQLSLIADFSVKRTRKTMRMHLTAAFLGRHFDRFFQQGIESPWKVAGIAFGETLRPQRATSTRSPPGICRFFCQTRMGTPRNLRMIIVVQLTRELTKSLPFVEKTIVEYSNTMFLPREQSRHNFLSQLANIPISFIKIFLLRVTKGIQVK